MTRYGTSFRNPFQDTLFGVSTTKGGFPRSTFEFDHFVHMACLCEYQVMRANETEVAAMLLPKGF